MEREEGERGDGGGRRRRGKDPPDRRSVMDTVWGLPLRPGWWGWATARLIDLWLRVAPWLALRHGLSQWGRGAGMGDHTMPHSRLVEHP